MAAPAFLIYPMIVNETCIGMFYADRNRKGALLSEAQREYMDKLRSMAIEAITKRPATGDNAKK